MTADEATNEIRWFQFVIVTALYSYAATNPL